MKTIEKIKAIAGAALILAGATGAIAPGDTELANSLDAAITVTGALVLLLTDRVPRILARIRGRS